MRLFFLAAALMYYGAGQAASYYFSSQSGNDSYTSIQAQNPSTPWRSLEKLNGLTILQPGDSLLFKRGDTFFGSIRPGISGVPGKPVVFSAYGTGPNPIITPLIRLTAWVPAGNGIWAASDAALNDPVNLVLWNGSLQEMGRYPNSNTDNKGYLTIDDFSGNQSITDSDLPASPSWTGAEVVIRKNRWAIERNLITAHSGTTLNYSSASSYEAIKGYGYFIQNDIRTLDRPGEWYFHAPTKKMHVYFGAGGPSSAVVEAPATDHVVSCSGLTYLVFNALTFRGGNTHSVKISGGSHITIRNCEILYSGRNGVDVSDHTGFTIENSRIRYSNSNGMDLAGSNSDAVIRNNRIEHTGLLPGMGEKAGSNAIGIQCYSNGAVIEYNEVLNSGYNGIAVKLNATTVKNNFISEFCLVKDDGGGIYSANGSNRTFTGARITGNVVVNGRGAPSGANSAASSAEGIYMDDNSNNAEILGNTVAHCSKGIFLHNARNITVADNTIFDNEYQLYVKHDKSGHPVRDLKVTDNIFFARQPTQVVSYLHSRLDDIRSMGSFDNNYYSRPLDEALVIFTSFKTGAGTRVEQWYDLEGWKAAFGKDPNSNKSLVQIAPYTSVQQVGSNQLGNGTFTENAHGVFGNKCTVAWSASGGLDGGCLYVVPSEAGSMLSLNAGAFQASKKYILRYSIIGKGMMSIGANLRLGGAPYKPITPIVRRKVSTTRLDHEILLVPSESQQSGALIFTVEGTDPYWLDNLQLFEANVSPTPADRFIRFEYNATRESKTISLDGEYKDIHNTTYAHQVVLAPFSSIILVKGLQRAGTPVTTAF